MSKRCSHPPLPPPSLSYRCPCKPQYGMAPPDPLILYDCVFEGLQWQREEEAHARVMAHFQHMWTSQIVKQVNYVANILWYS